MNAATRRGSVLRGDPAATRAAGDGAREHPMPFGARLMEDGRVRFRLWAPAAGSVELSLEEAAQERVFSMEAQGHGWFELVTHEAGAGARYRFRIDGKARVPDPASRWQPEDVHGPSQVVDPRAFGWTDQDWAGRTWEEAAIYEVHVGTFCEAGTFQGLKERLDHLVDLGVTALELMPVSDFPGQRNWGYDGVLPFAPESRYGTPEDLKDLVDTAHSKGLMIFLDVVYNHFGPEGNYLHAYAPQFFTDRHSTPWGQAVDFETHGSEEVRDFFVHNALYWLEEFHFDGLRLDAVHAIYDRSCPDILEELATAVKKGPGTTRHIHLMIENDHNASRYLRRDRSGGPQYYTAQWNDDIHHALHVLVTGEISGYYVDYATDPVRLLGRCLTEGFAYQGERSSHRGNAPRGEPTKALPLTAFVSFLQNHDQVGNRAFGERIGVLVSGAALRAATEILLLAPAPPMIFAGQEWGSKSPFLFFCDFGPDLAEAVTQGRRREFGCFEGFHDSQQQAQIPDPNASSTFLASRLNWRELNEPDNQAWLELHRRLLGVRQRHIVPRLTKMPPGKAHFRPLSQRALRVQWHLGDGSRLCMLANLGEEPLANRDGPSGRLIHATARQEASGVAPEVLTPWSTAWVIDDA